MSRISSPNTKLVHDHFRCLYDDITRGNQFLNARTWGLAILNVLLLALIVAFGGRWLVVMSTAAAVVGVGWLIYAERITTQLPGGGTWDQVWDNYLEVSDDELFERVLSELLASIEAGKNSNQRKGRALDGAAWALLVQCAAVVLMAAERL